MSILENRVEQKKLSDPIDVKLAEVADRLSFALPKYKADNFVGGAQITPFSKLRQWLMELRTREDACEHLECLVRKREIEIELERQKLEFISEPLKKELIEVGIKDMNIDLRKFQRNLNDAYRERQQFLDLIKDFLESEDGKLSDGRSMMEIFNDPELENKYEHEYWTVRMAKQAMLDMISYGRIGTGNLDSILMMKPEQQKEVLALASSYTINVDRNINTLMGMASANPNLIEGQIRDQLKIGNVNNQTEKLL